MSTCSDNYRKAADNYRKSADNCAIMAERVTSGQKEFYENQASHMRKMADHYYETAHHKSCSTCSLRHACTSYEEVDEFDSSLEMDVFMYSLSPKEQEAYQMNLMRRRERAHQLDMKQQDKQVIHHEEIIIEPPKPRRTRKYNL